MRFILSLLALMAFTVPSMAAENSDTQKTILVKGSKSYQVRYSKPETMTSPATIEPAAGVEMQSPKGENQPAVAPSSDEPKPSKMMKLHGKK
jgi:hypothetical protein